MASLPSAPRSSGARSSGPTVLAHGLFVIAALLTGAGIHQLTQRSDALARLLLATAIEPVEPGTRPHKPTVRLASTISVSEPASPFALDVDATELPDSLGRRIRDGVITTGSTPHRLILFTFDDGPDHITTPALLGRLDSAGVRAVFFLTASRIAGTNSREREQARIARDIVARGHVVGNHTLDHLQLPLLDNDGILAQLVGAENVFRSVFGRRPWLLRPPGGAISDRTMQIIAGRRYTTVLWNLGSGDTQVESAEEVFETWKRVFERRAQENGDRGGIILLHDTHPWSVRAFDLIIAYLHAENCRLLAEGRELYDIVDDLSLFFVPRGDAPAAAEAPPLVLPADVLTTRQARVREETAIRCAQP